MSDHPWIKSYPAGVRWDAEFGAMPVLSFGVVAAANGRAVGAVAVGCDGSARHAAEQVLRERRGARGAG